MIPVSKKDLPINALYTGPTCGLLATSNWYKLEEHGKDVYVTVYDGYVPKKIKVNLESFIRPKRYKIKEIVC